MGIVIPCKSECSVDIGCDAHYLFHITEQWSLFPTVGVNVNDLGKWSCGFDVGGGCDYRISRRWSTSLMLKYRFQTAMFARNPILISLGGTSHSNGKQRRLSLFGPAIQMLRDRGVYTHPPSRKEPTGAAKITTAAKRNAAQSKIKFRRPKQIRYKRIQPPKTILHTSLNTRKSSPFFASDRNRSGSILRSVPQFPPLGKRSFISKGGEMIEQKKHRTDSIKEARSKLLRASFISSGSLFRSNKRT